VLDLPTSLLLKQHHVTSFRVLHKKLTSLWIAVLRSGHIDLLQVTVSFSLLTCLGNASTFLRGMWKWQVAETKCASLTSSTFVIRGLGVWLINQFLALFVLVVRAGFFPTTRFIWFKVRDLDQRRAKCDQRSQQRWPRRLNAKNILRSQSNGCPTPKKYGEKQWYDSH